MILRKLLIGIIIVSIMVTGYSVYTLFTIYEKYEASNNVYAKVGELYRQQLEDTGEHEDEHQHQLVNLNKDYIGWLKIESTFLDYPVVKGDDNDFYLTHNFFKEKDFAGAIFMDYRNSRDQLDRHTIIYGHRMKDDSMFGTLSNYSNHDYWEKHRNIEWDFNGEIYTWEIISAYVTNDTNWMKWEFIENEYRDFLHDIQDQSNFSHHVDLTEEDHILTLSTCTINSTATERFIVHARLIEISEKSER